MDRLFLDANVLFSAAYRPDAGLLRLWKLRAELVTSAYALEEARVNLSEVEQRARLVELSKSMTVVAGITDRELPRGVKLKSKDKPILLAAIEAKATHLVTGDVRDFGPYFGKTIEGVLVLPPADYVRSRSNLSERGHRHPRTRRPGPWSPRP